MQAIAACRSGARCRAIDVLLINPRSCEMAENSSPAGVRFREGTTTAGWCARGAKLCGCQCSGLPWHSNSSNIAIVAGCWVFFSGWRTAGMRRINDLIEDPQKLDSAPASPQAHCDQLPARKKLLMMNCCVCMRDLHMTGCEDWRSLGPGLPSLLPGPARRS
jgi:hypothetical protein